MSATKDVPVKKARMNFRLDAEIKERVARAAAITGQEVTDFAVSTLSLRADEIIERHTHLELNEKDYNFFLASLSEDKKPSKRSRSAAERYRRGRRKGVKYIADRTNFGDA
jgi:Uncharacterized protein conserved in bacteria